jgi:hypothetical protein
MSVPCLTHFKISKSSYNCEWRVIQIRIAKRKKNAEVVASLEGSNRACMRLHPRTVAAIYFMESIYRTLQIPQEFVSISTEAAMLSCMLSNFSHIN